MRKLLALFLVMAMTSAVYAVPTDIIELWITSLNDQTIEPTKEIDVVASDWVNFDIVMTQTGAMNLMSLDAEISVDGLGTLDVGEPPVPPGTLTWPYNEGMNNWQWDVEGKSGAVATASFMMGMSGTLVDHFLIHCDLDDPANDVFVSVGPDVRWGGTIYSDGYSPYDGTWGPGIVLHNVPEPMTIVLLGLGGLALLRRRK